MKRVLIFLAAGSSAALLAAGAVSPAAAQSIGGFPYKEPGVNRPGAPGDRPGLRPEVVVSQDADSRVRTVAQAMRLVKPGGTILVKGGVYEENVVVTKPVEIRGVSGDYGRNAIFRPSPQAACLSIAPDSAQAAVSISNLIFEFDERAISGPCIDVRGGTVRVSDSFILPSNSDIPLRAAYGQMRPDLVDHIARPPRDARSDASAARIEGYVKRHAQAVGASHIGWDFLNGGTNVESYIHSRDVAGSGILAGPSAGIRVSAGDVSLDRNMIVGAKTAIEFASIDRAFVNGRVQNNVLVGNGVGISAAGADASLILERNTIRYNRGAGVKADVYDGLSVIANEIMGNETGIFLTEKVRRATINSNFVVQNAADAMKISSGFYGAVAANTFAENVGCTVQFFSAEQKFLNNVEVKLTAFKDFKPIVSYDQTNYAVGNDGDLKVKQKRRKNRDEGTNSLAACGDPLNADSRPQPRASR